MIRIGTEYYVTETATRELETDKDLYAKNHQAVPILPLFTLSDMCLIKLNKFK